MSPELVALYDQRADLPVSTFVDLFARAREHIDVLVYAAVFIHEAYPRLNDLVEIRTHSTTLYNSIYRADDQMLVNAHVWGVNA